MTIRESIKYIERLYKEIRVMEAKFAIEKDFEDYCDKYAFRHKCLEYFYKNMMEIIDKIDENELSTLKYYYLNLSELRDSPLYSDIDHKYITDIARHVLLRDNSVQL